MVLRSGVWMLVFSRNLKLFYWNHFLLCSIYSAMLILWEFIKFGQKCLFEWTLKVVEYMLQVCPLTSSHIWHTAFPNGPNSRSPAVRQAGKYGQRSHQLFIMYRSILLHCIHFPFMHLLPSLCNTHQVLKFKSKIVNLVTVFNIFTGLRGHHQVH
jgi:hypothetical protein